MERLLALAVALGDHGVEDRFLGESRIQVPTDHTGSSVIRQPARRLEDVAVERDVEGAGIGNLDIIFLCSASA